MSETEIFHIVSRSAWAAANSQAAPYAGGALATEGFIHCSTADQVVEVANCLFRGVNDLILLRIDPYGDAV